MRFPGGPMIGLLYECCPRPVTWNRRSRGTSRAVRRCITAVRDRRLVSVSQILCLAVLAHFPGRKRIALQTPSIGTWRTPRMCRLSRCCQRMSRFRSVPSCLALGYAIQARRSAFAASTTGPDIFVDLGERFDEDEDCIGLGG